MFEKVQTQLKLIIVSNAWSFRKNVFQMNQPSGGKELIQGIKYNSDDRTTWCKSWNTSA